MRHYATLRNGYDPAVVRHVAAVMLRHVRPQSRAEAFSLLDGKLPMYLFDRDGMATEIDRYFAGRHSAACGQ